MKNNKSKIDFEKFMDGLRRELEEGPPRADFSTWMDHLNYLCSQVEEQTIQRCSAESEYTGFLKEELPRLYSSAPDEKKG